MNIVDVDSGKIEKLQIDFKDIRKLIHPTLIMYKISKDLNLKNILAILQHPSKLFKIPGTTSIYLIDIENDKISCVRALVGNIDFKHKFFGILFKDRKPSTITIEDDKILFNEPKDKDQYAKIVVDKDRLTTDIFSIKHNLNIDKFEIYVKKSINDSTDVDIDREFIRKIEILYKYSPIIGEDSPVRRHGLKAIINKLVGLELREDVKTNIENVRSDLRFCCNYCDVSCLNSIYNYNIFYYDYMYSIIQDFVYDNDLLSRLKSSCDDLFYIVQMLYMCRFNYPEKLEKGFEKPSSNLYYSISMLGLCPLCMLLFSKSRDFNIDIPIQILKYLYKIDVKLDDFIKIIEKFRPTFRFSIMLKNVEDILKIMYQFNDVDKPVNYIHPNSILRDRKVQVAIDVVDVPERIIDIAFTCISSGIDIVEVGTPLLKYYGVKIVELLRSNLPEGTIIFADTKTMDVGDLEARIMYIHGADMVSTMAIGTLSKIKEAIFEAAKFDKILLIDLMQCENPIRKIEEMREILEKAYPWIIICVHRGITEQIRGMGIESDIDLIRKIREILPKEIPLAVAGGIKLGIAKKVVDAGANIVIVGAAIYTSRDIGETARKIVKEVKS